MITEKAPHVEIGAYTPAMGTSPVAVTVTGGVVPESGPVTAINWIWRREGGGWNPASREVFTGTKQDFAYTYTFTVPGNYELGIEAFGPGGATVSSTRQVRVVGAATTEGRLNALEGAVKRLEDWVAGTAAAKATAPSPYDASVGVKRPVGRPKKVR